MAHTVMNSAGEIAEFLTGNAPERPELSNGSSAEEVRKAERARDEQGRFVPEEKPAEPKTEPVETPEWVKRLGLTADQHKGVSEEITRIIGKTSGKQIEKRKESEEYAEAQYNARRAAEQRAEEMQRELDQLKAKQPPKEELKEPKVSDFKTTEEYIDARADWIAEKKFREREAQAAKDAEEARTAAIKKNASERVAKARELVEDWQETVAKFNVPVPDHLAAYLQESELLPELTYHFAKNRQDWERLAAMPARNYSDLQRLGVAIGKIESKLEPFATRAKSKGGPEPHVEPSGDVEDVEPTPAETLPTPARASVPVIQPLNVGSVSQVEKPAGKRSYAEDRAAWEKTHRRNLSVRQRH